MPVQGMRDILPLEVTPEAGEGTLGTWRCRTGPRLCTGATGSLMSARASRANHGCTGRVRGQLVAFRTPWAGGEGTAKVRTGLGKTRCPGSQGGLRKRGYGSRTEALRESAGFATGPYRACAADLSRLVDSFHGKESTMSVRRAKASFFSGCNSHLASVAPASSNRSGSGGNEAAEAFDGKGR